MNSRTRKNITVMHQQKGLALILVLMIFAITSVLAIAMVERQSSDMQRSSTMLTVQQARSYSFAAEEAVKTGLFLSWRKNKETVHNQEEWAQERRFPLSPGMAYIRIRDAQGRFNLNTLSPQAANQQRQVQRFTNLLNLLGIDPIISVNLTNWMNNASQVDNLYLRKEPPYRAAFQPCKHTTELLLIEGMGLEEYRLLEPYIACLPTTAYLNVNTASPMVLAALDASLTLSQGEAIAAARGESGFATLDEFWGLSQVQPFVTTDENNKEQQPWVQTDFGVNSEYFEAFIRVDLAERIASSEVLIKRDAGNGTLTTLYRDYSRREARLEPAPQNDSELNQVQDTAEWKQ